MNEKCLTRLMLNPTFPNSCLQYIRDGYWDQGIINLMLNAVRDDGSIYVRDSYHSTSKHAMLFLWDVNSAAAGPGLTRLNKCAGRVYQILSEIQRRHPTVSWRVFAGAIQSHGAGGKRIQGSTEIRQECSWGEVCRASEVHHGAKPEEIRLTIREERKSHPADCLTLGTLA